MPLSFATILGGMATLIGTPPNIIIASIREESLGEPFAMFDFAPVGGLTAIIGLTFVAFIGWRLIPQREDALKAVEDLGAYIAELTLPEDSKQIGQRLSQLDPEAEKADVAIIGLIRDGKRRYGRRPQRRAPGRRHAGARSRPRRAWTSSAARSASPFPTATARERLKAAGEGLDMIEVVVPRRGAHRRTVGPVHRPALAPARGGHGPLAAGARASANACARTVIEPGDILLLLVPKGSGAGT